MSTSLSEAELQSIEAMTPAPSGEPAERFILTCVEWAKEWIRVNSLALGKAAIPPTQSVLFVFSETPDLEREKLTALGSLQETVFKVSVAQETQGVILCNENFQQMVRIGSGQASLDATLDFASKSLSHLRTFVVINFAQRRLFLHRKGDDLANWLSTLEPMELSFQDAPLSADRIEKDVEEFHHNHLAKPTNNTAQTLWMGKNHPYKLYPAPEKRVQVLLRVMLTCSYRHLQVLVDEEPQTRDGRCDLRVAWPIFGVTPGMASTMIELKVLYESQGVGFHRGWVLSGITQAEGYRRPDSEAVYACIFDGRKDVTEQFTDLDAVASTKNVRLRRYRMEPPPPAPTKKAAAKKAVASSGAKKTTGDKKRSPARKQYRK